MQTECKKPSLLEIFAEVQPILYKNASKIKANHELHKSLDDFKKRSLNLQTPIKEFIFVDYKFKFRIEGVRFYRRIYEIEFFDKV